MIGGSADLTGSNNTLSSSNTELLPEKPRRNSYLLWGKRVWNDWHNQWHDSSWWHQTL